MLRKRITRPEYLNLAKVCMDQSTDEHDSHETYVTYTGHEQYAVAGTIDV